MQLRHFQVRPGVSLSNNGNSDEAPTQTMWYCFLHIPLQEIPTFFVVNGFEHKSQRDILVAQNKEQNDRNLIDSIPGNHPVSLPRSDGPKCSKCVYYSSHMLTKISGLPRRVLPLRGIFMVARVVHLMLAVR